MKKQAGMLFILVGMAAAAASVAQAQTLLKPQQVIQFKANAYGCLSKDKLDAAYQHAQAGENQQMQEYFAGFQCLSAPEHSDFRIINVVGDDVEFVNAGNSDSHGLWANRRFIKE